MPMALGWRLFSAMSLLAYARVGRRQLPILMDESRLGRRSQLHLQAVHTLLMPPVEAVALRCRPVYETPIYDQLRDEGITFLEHPYRLDDTRAVMIEGPSHEAIELVEVK